MTIPHLKPTLGAKARGPIGFQHEHGPLQIRHISIQLFTAGYAGSWGGGAQYKAVDGAFIARYEKFDSRFGDPVSVVASDGKFVYFGAGGRGILRAPQGGAQGAYEAFLAGVTVQGLFIKNSKMYVSDFGQGKIRVLQLPSMAEEQSWECKNPTRLTVDNSGHVWVVVYNPASPQPPTGGPMWWGEKIVSFSPSGEPGPEITDFDRPLAVAMNERDQLLVGGLNENSQIWIYNLSGGPTKAGAFGAEGGIFSGTPGAFTKKAKLHWIKAITVDTNGDIYTGCTYGTFWGNCIEKWRRDGSLQWRLFAGTSLDCAGIDPDHDTEVYSKYHHYSLDYSRTNSRIGPRGIVTPVTPSSFPIRTRNMRGTAIMGELSPLPWLWRAITCLSSMGSDM